MKEVREHQYDHPSLCMEYEQILAVLSIYITIVYLKKKPILFSQSLILDNYGKKVGRNTIRIRMNIFVLHTQKNNF